jgi:hypothetical protein
MSRSAHDRGADRASGRRATPTDVERAAQGGEQADDQTAEAYRAEAQRQDEVAAVHELFAEEHESAAESLPDDLAEAHRGAADKHRQAAHEDRAQAQNAREEADAEHN